MERALDWPEVPELVKSQWEDLNLGTLAPEAGLKTRKPPYLCEEDRRAYQGGVGAVARWRSCHPTLTGCQTIASATSHGLGGSTL